MYGREKDNQLGALADGELNETQARALQAALERDHALRAEYDAQVEVKALLGGLPHASAPDYMATRILGEIATRRRRSALPGRWRPAVAWLGSAAALVVGFGTAVGLWPRVMQSETLLADQGGPRANVIQAAAMTPSGLWQDPHYSPQYWETVPLPEGVSDPKLQQFLQFANAAHNYRRLQHGSNRPSPDMAQVMLALDESPTAPVVWASAEGSPAEGK